MSSRCSLTAQTTRAGSHREPRAPLSLRRRRGREKPPAPSRPAHRPILFGTRAMWTDHSEDAYRVPPRVNAALVAVPPPNADGADKRAPAGGRLFLYGGDDNNSPLGDLWVYDIESNKWEEPLGLQGAKPSPRSRHSFTLVRARRIETQLEEDRLYLYGGVGTRTEDVMYLDLLRREWVTPRTIGDRAIALLGHGSAQIGTSIYVVGGRDARRAYNDVWSLDTTSHEWSRKQPSGTPPPPCSKHVVAAREQRLYVALGEVARERIFIYDTVNNAWLQAEVAADTPAPPLTRAGGLLIGNEMTVFGGTSAAPNPRAPAPSHPCGSLLGSLLGSRARPPRRGRIETVLSPHISPVRLPPLLRRDGRAVPLGFRHDAHTRLADDVMACARPRRICAHTAPRPCALCDGAIHVRSLRTCCAPLAPHSLLSLPSLSALSLSPLSLSALSPLSLRSPPPSPPPSPHHRVPIPACPPSPPITTSLLHRPSQRAHPLRPSPPLSSTAPPLSPRLLLHHHLSLSLSATGTSSAESIRMATRPRLPNTTRRPWFGSRRSSMAPPQAHAWATR